MARVIGVVPASVSGWADVRFAPVCRAFADLVAAGVETGAAVAAVCDGMLVLDLYGGWQDAARTRPWTPDTVVSLFGAGNLAMVAGLLVLVGRGQVDLDAPVAGYWPEFAAAGKEEVLVRQLLSHTVGLPGFPRLRPTRSLRRWAPLCRDLAAAAALWPAGMAVAVQALPFGHLVGELIRRVDGRPVATFLRQELTDPWGLDLILGLTGRQHSRAAELEYADPDWPRRLLGPPDTLRHLAMGNPQGWHDLAELNSGPFRAASVPSINMHATAPALAGLHAALLAGGRHRGLRLLDPELAAAVGTVHGCGRDALGGQNTATGLGVVVEPDGQYHTPTIGGTLAVADPTAGYTLAYLSRRLDDDARAQLLLSTLHDCL